MPFIPDEIPQGRFVPDEGPAEQTKLWGDAAKKAWGSNVAGAAEAVLTMPFEFAAGLGGRLGGTIQSALPVALGGRGDPSIAGMVAGGHEGAAILSNLLKETGISPTGSTSITPMGDLAKEAIGHYAYEVPKEYAARRAQEVEKTPEMGARAQSATEAMIDMALAGVLGSKRRAKPTQPPLTPAELQALRNIQNPPPPPAATPAIRPTAGEQLALPMEGAARNPYIREPLRMDEQGIPYAEALSRDVAQETRTAGPQGELFLEPTRPGLGALEAKPEGTPIAGAEYGRMELPKKEIPPVLESALLDTSIEVQRIKQMLDNTKTEDLRGQFPVAEFPFRQEALARDPKIFELREKWEKAAESGNKNLMRQALLDAEIYLDNAYNINKGTVRNPLYEGRAIEGRGTALPIEPTIRPPLGVPERGTTPFSKAKGGLSSIIDERGTLLADTVSGPTRNILGRFAKQQGGYIHPDLLGGKIADLIKRVGEKDALKLFKGTFSPEHMATLMRTFAGRNPYARVVWMSPDQFLALAAKRGDPRYQTTPGWPVISPGRTAQERHTAIRGALSTARGLGDGPWLTFDVNARTGKAAITGHEGRHRMDVFKERGMDLIPVMVEHDRGRGGLAAGFPARMGEQYGLSNPQRFGAMFDMPQPSLWAKKQRGSLGDPEFFKFKDKLPEPMKKDASRLYKELKRLEKEDPTLLQHPTETLSIPGWEKALEEVAPFNKPYAEVRDVLLHNPDTNMSTAGRLVRSGAVLTGFETQSPLIRYAGEVINGHLKTAEIAKRELLLNPETGLKPLWEKMPMKEQVGIVMEILKEEGKMDLTRADLLERGFKERQIVAYEKFHEIRTRMKEWLHEAGMKFKDRLGYFPSRFRGDFLFNAYDKNGVIFHRMGGNTIWEARRVKKFMEERYPEYTFDEPVHRKTSGPEGRDVQAGIRELMNMLEESDPRIAALESTFREYLSKEGYDYLNVKRHALPKRKEGIPGFEGKKEWASAERNAKDAIHSFITYVEQGLDWIEIQKATKTLREIFADGEMVQNHPNALKYIQLYWDMASGRGSTISRTIDHVADAVGSATGFGRTNIVEMNRTIKSALTLKFLLNPAFLGSQLAQPLQFVPHWIEYLNTRGLQGSKTRALTFANLDNLLAYGNPEKMTTVGRESLQWAKENHIFEGHIMDDVRNLSSKKYLDAADAFIRRPLQVAEQVARQTAYLQYIHYLHESGVPKGKTMYQMAWNITDMSMTNYHLHERPLLYQQMGVIGEMASALTTFKHNQYHQLVAFNRTKVPTKAKAQIYSTMIGMELLAAGLMGFYLRDEVDSLIEAINMLNAQATRYVGGMPNLLPVGGIPTTRAWLLKNLGDVPGLVYGGWSKLSGMDMHSKYSAADVLPQNISGFINPFGRELMDMGTSALEWMVNPMNPMAAYKAAHIWAPTAVKWAVELVGREPSDIEGKSYLIDPKTGNRKYEREGFDWFSRAMGVRSIPESMESQRVQEAKQQDRYITEMKAALLDRAEKDMKNPERLRALAQQYVAHGGTEADFRRGLIQRGFSKKLTDWQRLIGVPITPQQAERANRIMEFQGDGTR